MNQSLKLTVAWLLLVVATILSYILADIDKNGVYVGILAIKKFLLIGFIYLEGSKAHWFYKILLIMTGLSLVVGNLIWGVY